MSKPDSESFPRFHPTERGQWRAWLEVNHASAAGVWLISYEKASGQPRVPYAEAVEEALCFGWIDSRQNTLDAERAMQLFTPRKPKSPWSRLNKERVARLIRDGCMAPAGLAAVEAARRDGSWDAYDAVEALTIPDDLARALAANAEAETHFTAFSTSSKKTILWWIASAKRSETRARRVAETVELAAQNRKANHWRQ